MSKAPLAAASGVFLFLIAASNRGFWGFLLRNPGAFDTRSVGLILSRDLLPIAFISLLSLLAAALGRALVKRSPELPGGPFALGAGALACAVFLLGLAHGLNATGFALLGACAAAFAWRELRLPRIGLPQWTVPQSLLAGLVLSCAFHYLIAALAPPTEWDSLSYHLALPKLYLRAGGLTHLPWMIHSHWPHLMEVFYAVPLSIGLDNAPALWHLALSAAWLGSVWGFGRKVVGEDGAWIAAALLAAQPALLDVAGAPHSDGAFAFFTFMAVAAVWTWTERPDRPLLLLGALFAGLAAACKFHGVVQILSLAGWVGLKKKDFRPALTFLACGLAVSGPWYLLSMAHTGNPIWPFFSALFGGTPGIEERFLAAQGWRDPAMLLRFGPQYLLIPVAALFALRRGALPGFVRFYLGLALPYLLFVWKSDAAWRYMLVFMPALALAAGAWAAGSMRRSGWRRWAAAGALAFGLSPVLFLTSNNPLFFAAGLRSRLEPEKDPREIYLERSLDSYRAYSRINRELGPQARVLLFREIRGYYLDADYRWGDPINQGMILYSRLKDGRALLARLSELGITHVLVNEGIGMYMESPGYYDRHTLGLMEEALGLAGTPVLREGALTLYELRLNLSSWRSKAA